MVQPFTAIIPQASSAKVHPLPPISATAASESSAKIKTWLQVAGLPMTKHGIEADAKAKDSSSFILFSQNELNEREITVKEGLVYRGKVLLNTPSARFKLIWVMHKDGRIYADYSIEGKLFHSSLMNNELPIAAGEMTGIRGKMGKVNANSGHYQPHDRLHILKEELQSRGLFLSDAAFKESPHNSPHNSPINMRRKITVGRRPSQLRISTNRNDQQSSEPNTPATPLVLPASARENPEPKSAVAHGDLPGIAAPNIISSIQPTVAVTSGVREPIQTPQPQSQSAATPATKIPEPVYLPPKVGNLTVNQEPKGCCTIL